MLEDSLPRRQLFSSPAQLWLIAGQLMNTPVRISQSDSALMLGTAAALAVLTDVLFNGAQLGINVALWHLALIGGVVFCAKRMRGGVEPRRMVLLLVSLGFSVLVALRASPALQAFDLMAALGLLTIALALPPRAGLHRIGPVAPLLAFAAGLASLALGAYRLAVALPGENALAVRLRDDAIVVGRALIFAVPVLLVFGGLFVAADAVFESKVKAVFDLDVPDVWQHVLYLAAGFWLAIAALWSGVVVEVPDDLHADLPETRRLRPIETSILLLPLALLFLAFVLVQLRYLFGGAEVVLDSIDLTYSQYARRGFFELVVASILLLPILLTVNWARRQDQLSTQLFRLFAGALVVLLAVVMASAWQRLSIYVDALGLTQLRFYAAVALVWLGLAFVWFTVCIIGPGRNLFLSGVALAAIAVLMAVNLLNPDALIARTNTSRLDAGRTFDAEHAAGLSADAAPSLLNRMDGLSPQDQCILAQILLTASWTSKDDVRSFNLGRHRAQRAVEAKRDLLEASCG